MSNLVERLRDECNELTDEAADLIEQQAAQSNECRMCSKAPSEESRLRAEVKILQEQNAVLLVAIAQMTQHIKTFRNEPALEHLHKLRASEGYRLLTVAMDIGVDGPSTELLEIRDRKRDAKLLRAIAEEYGAGEVVYPVGYLSELADIRESGEWKPEL